MGFGQQSRDIKCVFHLRVWMKRKGVAIHLKCLRDRYRGVHRKRSENVLQKAITPNQASMRGKVEGWPQGCLSVTVTKY